MRIRIPNRVNRALDAVERGRWVSAAVMVAAAVAVVAVAVAMDQMQAGFGAVGIGALAYLTADSWARGARLREQIRQRDYELAAERRANKQLREGDPSAPTAQLRAIGESGELT
jgi:hypothetical protein